MKALIFLGGLIVGALLGAGVIVYLEARASLNAKDDIIFAKKTFYAGETFAAISGTLTGDELAYPNNTHSFGCFREQAECFVNYVEQIGVKQIGRLTAPTAYPIIKWDAFEIVARDEPVVGCFRTTITIGRKTESLL